MEEHRQVKGAEAGAEAVVVVRGAVLRLGPDGAACPAWWEGMPW